jgi:hypothetical protein
VAEAELEAGVAAQARLAQLGRLQLDRRRGTVEVAGEDPAQRPARGDPVPARLLAQEALRPSPLCGR